MIGILADVAAGTDPMISGNWLIGILGTIGTITAAILGKIMGKREGENSREVTLKKPVPTVVTREEPQWATKPELEDHIENTRAELTRVWDQFGVERKIQNEDNTKIHDRLNRQSEATAKLQGSVDSVNSNVNKLLDIALNRKPTTGR